MNVPNLQMISEKQHKIGIQNLASTMFAVQDRILTFGVSQSSQESPIEEVKEQSVQYENSKPSKTVIVGVGPAGLATAIMLAR